MLGLSIQIPKPFLAPPVSAQADRGYLKEKIVCNKTNFAIESHDLSMTQRAEVRQLLENACHRREDKLLMFSENLDEPSHSFGVLVSNGNAYAVGTVLPEDKDHLDGDILYPEKTLQCDQESCHLYAYKSAKAVFSALQSADLYPDGDTRYKLPENLSKYAQSPSELMVTRNTHYGVGRMDRLLTEDGMEHFANSQSALLSYRSYKKFFKHASQDELRIWLQEDEVRFFNDDIKRAIIAYESNSISQEKYRGFIDGYLSFKF